MGVEGARTTRQPFRSLSLSSVTFWKLVVCEHYFSWHLKLILSYILQVPQFKRYWCKVCRLNYNLMYLFAYCNTNVMMKTYFSDETYKLSNLSHHRLFALDRSIAGHDVSHYCEQFKTYRKLPFSFNSHIQMDRKWITNGRCGVLKWGLRFEWVQ
jgi:hypothetical protein